jgi:hypothetical protein
MRACIALFCLLLAASAGAQYQVEDQTQDHEEIDSRYYERYDGEPQKDTSLEDFLERADELIRDRHYRSASGEHYRVQSDDPRLNAKAAVGLLESFRAHFVSLWSGRVPMADYDQVSRLFLFYSFHKFNQTLAEDFRFNSLRPKGHYGSLFDVITMHTDSGCAEDLANTLVHEAAHQLVDQRLFGVENVRPVPWLSEGLASYFGYTLQDATGSFRAGEVGGKQAQLLKDVRSRSGSEIKAVIRAGKQAFKESKQEGESLVEELVSSENPSSFYGPRVRLNYAASWILVHYLLHGDDGIHAEPFIAYLQLAGRGSVEPQRLFELLGMSPGELDAALERHLNGLKQR